MWQGRLSLKAGTQSRSQWQHRSGVPNWVCQGLLASRPVGSAMAVLSLGHLPRDAVLRWGNIPLLASKPPIASGGSD